MTELKKQKARLEELSNNISERLGGTKPVRNEVASERGYCRIISVGRNRRMREANEIDEELLVLSAISYIICFVSHFPFLTNRFSYCCCHQVLNETVISYIVKRSDIFKTKFDLDLDALVTSSRATAAYTLKNKSFYRLE